MVFQTVREGKSYMWNLPNRLGRKRHNVNGHQTVDFSVTYRNNVNVGTATLILHGKGAYKGQKIVTFNIAR